MRGSKTTPSAELLRERLRYDPDTGQFFWLKALGNGEWRSGHPAGCTHPEGYVMIGLMGKSYPAHRLAWLYVTGAWPTGMIDHLNGIRADNRFANLRDVVQSINAQNMRQATPRSKTGFLGVSEVGGSRPFRAQIRIGPDSKRIGLGRFKTAEEAHSAYLEAKRKFHPGCTI